MWRKWSHLAGNLFPVRCFGVVWSHTHVFYKKLGSGNEYSVSYENGLFRVLSFFAVSYPGAICAIFVQKIRSFSEKSLDSFLCTWNMSTRFLNSEKIEYWFLIKRFLIKKPCVPSNYLSILKYLLITILFSLWYHCQYIVTLVLFEIGGTW